MRLVEPTGSKVIFHGQDLGAVDKLGLQAIRHNLQIIFQDPYSSLNPRLTVEQQTVTEPMVVHGIGTNRADRSQRAADLLVEVGLLPEHLKRYPSFQVDNVSAYVLARWRWNQLPSSVMSPSMRSTSASKLRY